MDRFLKEIASNLWNEWSPDAKQLFHGFSPHIWSLANKNPYRFLALRAENPIHYEKRFAELVIDKSYQRTFEKVKDEYQKYINPSKTIVSERYPELKDKTVAYFSMEYGFDTLKIYSGGLGILSGDHVRGASDLGIKLVAVGLFYLQGYYEQKVTDEGEMQVAYDSIVPPRAHVREYLPLEAVKRKGTTEDLLIDITVDDRIVYAKVWKVRVGRVELLLLDTNVSQNPVHDRHLSRRLYASEKQYDDERKRRIEQELVLGIGGVRALEAAGYQPAVYHLNEGHVAFAAFEVIRQIMANDHLPFQEARERAAKIIGFTTHTPVPEGNERFNEALVRRQLGPYLAKFLSPDEQEVIFNCARNEKDEFDMTKLSLLFSGVFRNGVSKLHGEVCRKMWHYAWGNQDGKSFTPPIDSITNGVHIPYWTSPEIQGIVDKAGGPAKINSIDDEVLWKVHLYRKERMIVELRERLAYHLLRANKSPEEVADVIHALLDPNAFVIGFARRFAGYKRITFFLDDEERLFSFLENAYKKYGQPVHIIFAGKPHPNNYQGRDQIKHIYEISSRLRKRAQQRKFKAQIMFVEGYDIALARRLVSGVDVWLNNPIRPLEASGTSGMKAGANGILNISISDGWVAEGVRHGENGWIFGSGDEASGEKDRKELFQLLENTVLPLYFERPKKLSYSPGWVKMMKDSMKTMMQDFSMERMLIEYIEKMYLPAVRALEGARR